MLMILHVFDGAMGSLNKWNVFLVSTIALHLCTTIEQPLRCTFTDGQSCDLVRDAERWKIEKAPFIFYGRTVINSGQDDDYFALFEPSEYVLGEQDGQAYDIRTAELTPGQYYISFWYAMPTHYSNISILVTSAQGASVEWSFEGGQTNWTEQTLNIIPKIPFKIVFRCYRISSHYGAFVGIDNIKISKHAAPCFDVNTQCAEYGVDYICVGDYIPWSEINCRKFCNLCNDDKTTTMTTAHMPISTSHRTTSMSDTTYSRLDTTTMSISTIKQHVTTSSNIVDHCLSAPCKNGGSCESLPGTFHCYCPIIYGGRHCDVDLDECQVNNPCKNGGTCFNRLGGFDCTCTHGFTGRTCETHTDCSSMEASPCWKIYVLQMCNKVHIADQCVQTRCDHCKLELSQPNAVG